MFMHKYNPKRNHIQKQHCSVISKQKQHFSVISIKFKKDLKLNLRLKNLIIFIYFRILRLGFRRFLIFIYKLNRNNARKICLQLKRWKYCRLLNVVPFLLAESITLTLGNICENEYKMKMVNKIQIVHFQRLKSDYDFYFTAWKVEYFKIIFKSIRKIQKIRAEFLFNLFYVWLTLNSLYPWFMDYYLPS